MWKLTKRTTNGFFGVMAVLMLSGAVYQFIVTKIEETIYPPPGKMVDIGGYRLHIYGAGQGNPTVVFDAGMGCNSLDWALVQPEVAKFTRVCSYDRAGNGWSDESPLERTSLNIVEELHSLLNKAGEKGPYILVGHSFGGPNVLLFASKYPDEVAGIILVDSSHEDHLLDMPDWPQSLIEKMMIHPWGAKFLSSIGLTRLYIYLPSSEINATAFPKEIQSQYLATMSTTKNILAVTEEFQQFSQSLYQLRTQGKALGDMPLIVITAKKSLTSEEPRIPKEFGEKVANIWDALQKDLVSRSSEGKQVIADCGHMVTREKPEVIVEAIQEMVEKNR